jgi:hypothetical protein
MNRNQRPQLVPCIALKRKLMKRSGMHESLIEREDREYITRSFIRY